MKVSRYRLPDQLGGGIVEGVTENGYAPSIVIVTIDGVEIPFNLELLKPVAYNQPVAGFVFIPDTGSEYPSVFYRNASWPPNQWLSYMAGPSTKWADVCQVGEPRTLHAQTPGTGRCSGCDRITTIRKDGMIHQHGAGSYNGGRGCPGSNKPPREEP